MTTKEQARRAVEAELVQPMTLARLLWARLRLWWQTRHARAAIRNVFRR